ncbi:unnamed protein product [Symbiodinium sp. CCMP2592]|nr:unnamed protein product [Symbiodinium sp. CCMP2592]
MVVMVTTFCRRSWGRERVGSNLLPAVKTKAAFQRKTQELGTLASYLCVFFPLRIMAQDCCRTRVVGGRSPMKWPQWAVALLLPCRPVSAALKSRTPAPPGLDSALAWKEFTDPSGQHFQLNVLTGEAQWDLNRAHKETEPDSEIGAAEKSVAAARAKPAESASSKPVTQQAQMPDPAAMHGWLDSWLGWGETVADPASQEVRADVAKDLGLPAPPSEAHGLRRHTVEAVRTKPTAESPRAGQVHAAGAYANSGTAGGVRQRREPQRETRIAMADEPPTVVTDAAAEEMLANIGRIQPDLEQEAIRDSEDELMLEEVARVLHDLEASQEKLLNRR